MEQPQKLEKVVSILEKQGVPETQITDLLAELTKASYARLYADAALHFQEQDLDAIEACRDQAEADQKIRELYTIRVGKDPDQKVDELLTVFADGFLADIRNQTNAANTNSNQNAKS